MQKKITLLLTAILVISAVPQVSYGIANPLKSYDLYADTHRQVTPANNVQQKRTVPITPAAVPPQAVPTTADGGVNVNAEVPQRRNVYLRESSKKVYGSGSGNWTKGPYFYDHPTLDSIKKKYRLSNFAGCLQESEAYVKKNPFDTLGYYYLAMSYAKCGDKDNAVKAYEKVISLNANPMIVKYATNGRNCVMGNSDAKCFQDVNVPELYYPYREMAKNMDLTPVDPQTLINRNLASWQESNASQAPSNAQGEEGKENSGLPFSNQDEQLDKFINAPYGSGLSPELELEYKQQQLKNIQQEINKDDMNSPGKYFQNIRNIKEFDSENSKSDASDFEPIKLALADNMDIEALLQSPEYIQNKKELDELQMMLGSSNSSSDITSMLPNLAKEGENISPQVVQMMMMQSVMPNIINFDSNNGF